MGLENKNQVFNGKDRLSLFGEVWGERTDWKNIANWIDEQENYFYRKRIEDDDKKIQHIIMNIDVRHWSKLENFYKYNQQGEATYDTLKNVLIKRTKKILDPTMKKYDEKVESYIDKLKITSINLENLKIWLKKLRSLCDGQAKEEYLVTKVLNRVVEVNREKILTNLMTEIKRSIDIYEERIKINNNTIGKEKKKELNRLKALKATISKFIEFSIHNYQ